MITYIVNENICCYSISEIIQRFTINELRNMYNINVYIDEIKAGIISPAAIIKYIKKEGIK